MEYMESVKKLEEKMIENQQKHIFNGCIHAKCIGEGLEVIISEDDSELKKLHEEEIHMKKEAGDEINKLRSQSRQYTEARASGDAEILRLQKVLEDKVYQKKKFEEEIIILSSQPLQLTFEADQMRQRLGRGGFGNGYGGLGSPMSQVNHSQFRDSGDRQKTPVASLFEQVELQKDLVPA
ncbi:hypothetical protein SLEP1_g2632 [Rubroshorea leprosula]|uniref:Uncharacterized protein n=1 Tax=Rubroshorea leprosula TaxID=152421 RepID=A0AAV5HNR6_9ROSI|nr:hypothetical protein SLEP1_g2632 [Rubroshorea leprosula]